MALKQPTLELLARSKYVITDKAVDFDIFFTVIKDRIIENEKKWEECLNSTFYTIGEADL